MQEIDGNELYIGYRNLMIYLVIFLIACALCTLYLLYLYQTGDAHTFNLTEGQWEIMKNSSSMNLTKVMTPVELNLTSVGV